MRFDSSAFERRGAWSLSVRLDMVHVVGILRGKRVV